MSVSPERRGQDPVADTGARVLDPDLDDVSRTPAVVSSVRTPPNGTIRFASVGVGRGDTGRCVPNVFNRCRRWPGFGNVADVVAWSWSQVCRIRLGVIGITRSTSLAFVVPVPRRVARGGPRSRTARLRLVAAGDHIAPTRRRTWTLPALRIGISGFPRRETVGLRGGGGGPREDPAPPFAAIRQGGHPDDGLEGAFIYRLAFFWMVWACLDITAVEHVRIHGTRRG